MAGRVSPTGRDPVRQPSSASHQIPEVQVTASAIPSEPRCDCGAPAKWVAWTLDENQRMQDLWTPCHPCSLKLPKLRHDHEVLHFFGAKRAFFMLEDIVDNYSPTFNQALVLIRVARWGARQEPHPKSRGIWDLVGFDPEET